jgi:hypothetical protein
LFFRERIQRPQLPAMRRADEASSDRAEYAPTAKARRSPVFTSKECGTMVTRTARYS